MPMNIPTHLSNIRQNNKISLAILGSETTEPNWAQYGGLYGVHVSQMCNAVGEHGDVIYGTEEA